MTMETEDGFGLLIKHDFGRISTGEIGTIRDESGNQLFALTVRDKLDNDNRHYRWLAKTQGTPVLEFAALYSFSPPYRQADNKWFAVHAPLARLRGEHEFKLCYGPTFLAIYIDGELIDQEWPYGELAGKPEKLDICEGIDVKISEHRPSGQETDTIAGHDLQYWTPPGYNQWMGDTMMSTWNGRLHMPYLLDRRQGASRSGSGAHSTSQLTTSDLKSWTLHSPILPVEREWESHGTGNMIYHRGKYYLFYGLHTSRVIEDDLVCDTPSTNSQWPSEASELPMGTTYATSDEGFHFEKSWEVIHKCQNPSVFKRHPNDDTAYMLAGYGAEGLYKSTDLKNWELVNPSIVPIGSGSALKATSECQCYFVHNGYHYIIGGRTGMWTSRSFLGPYSADALRWDIYDGIWVPMVTRWGERLILSGWLQDNDGNTWGGTLVFRELFQESDGTLAMGWAPELTPTHSEFTSLGNADLSSDTITSTCFEIEGDALVSTQIEATAESFGLCFCSDGIFDGGCELRFEPQRNAVQWGSPENGDPAPAIQTSREYLAEHENLEVWHCDQKTDPIPFRGGNYALGGFDCLNRSFSLKIIIKYEAKSNRTIIDAWIDGRRTMITGRNDLTGKRIHFYVNNGSARFSDVSCAKLG